MFYSVQIICCVSKQMQLFRPTVRLFECVHEMSIVDMFTHQAGWLWRCVLRIVEKNDLRNYVQNGEIKRQRET